MRNRDVQLNIRLTKAEYENLLSNSEKCGLGISAYLRSLMEGNAPKECPPIKYHELMEKLRTVAAMIMDLHGNIQADELKQAVENYQRILLDIQSAVLLPGKVNC